MDKDNVKTDRSLQMLNKIRSGEASESDVDLAVRGLMEYMDMDEKDATAFVRSLGDGKIDVADFYTAIEAVRSVLTDNERSDDETEEGSEPEDGEEEDAEGEEEEGEEEEEEEDERSRNHVVVNVVKDRLRSTPISTTSEQGISYEMMDSAVINWAERVRSGAGKSIDSIPTAEMARFKAQCEQDGTEFTLTRAVNTLATAGTNNVSIENSIVDHIVAFAFVSDFKDYQLGSTVRRVPTTSNVYSGQMIGEPTVRNRTQSSSTDPFTGNDQGSLSSFTATLGERTLGIRMDMTGLTTQGNAVAELTRSIEAGIAKHIDGAIVTAVTGASGTVSLGIGASNSIDDLTFNSFQSLKSKVEGGDNRVIAMSRSTLDYMYSLVDTTRRPIFSMEGNVAQGESPRVAGNRVVLSSSMPTSTQALTATAYDFAYVGDLNRAVSYVYNTVTSRSGAEYNYQTHTIDIYSHFGDVVAVERPGLIGVYKTRTA